MLHLPNGRHPPCLTEPRKQAMIASVTEAKMHCVFCIVSFKWKESYKNHGCKAPGFADRLCILVCIKKIHTHRFFIFIYTQYV